MKICIVHVFFGELPPWFSMFTDTCMNNNQFDFLILTDNKRLQLEAANISVQFFTRGDFEKLAIAKLGFAISISKPYKLCDFKPAFGIIFNNFLKKYDFWAYCDNDIVVGNVASFISIEEFQSYDIISTYNNFMSGPLCFYRNSEKVNMLFTKIINYKRVLQSPDWCAIEENYIGLPGVCSKIGRFIRKVDFYIVDCFNGDNTPQIKFNNFWIHKRKRMNTKCPRDISEVIWREQSIGKIKIMFKDLLKSDREYVRMQHPDWKVTLKKGKLNSNFQGKEILGFHFVESKNDSEFRNSFKKVKDEFILTKQGMS